MMAWKYKFEVKESKKQTERKTEEIKKDKFNVKNILNVIINFIIPVVGIIWVGGLLIEMLKGLIDKSQFLLIIGN